MSEKKQCIFSNKKTGKGCNIKKVNDQGLCIRHKKKEKKENIETKPELTLKTKIAKIDKKDIYKDMFENEEEIIEEDNEENEIEEKKEVSETEIRMVKYGYLAIIGWSEILLPDHLEGAKTAIENDKYIDEILKEVANDYTDVLGFSQMDPGLKLLIVTAMTLGTVAAINVKKNRNKNVVSMNNDNDYAKKLEEDIEKQFEDI